MAKQFEIENNLLTNQKHERSDSDATSSFHAELHLDQTNPLEQAKLLDMVRENDKNIESIRKQADQCADRVCQSLFKLPISHQEEFYASISKFDDKDDLVYARVRQNLREHWSTMSV
ncbi:MAG: hypothetical protein J0H83_02735 [Candidatus Melainabacteria bacterium]|jgi:hypothetical protein|nr:hypothetical protein [Candidatus Melainabacteria bacterium]MBX9672406.1 hypothetical protein [Candidatus Obscuribacterales bacterium]